MSQPVQRIAILAPELAGYTAACQRRLKEKYGVELLVVHWPVAGEAPFREAIFAHIDHRYEKDQLPGGQLPERLREFNPQALLISGWMDKDYLRVARQLKKEGVPVIAGSDTQWTGSPRQRAGGWIAPRYLHPAIDVLWVTGERQRQLAHHLGYRGERCWTGYYACDWERFATPQPRRPENALPAFLYAGRLIPRKGLDTLLAAYRAYRQSAAEPWELWVAGTGPLASTLENEAGVRPLGFVQPDELPALFQQVRAFVLPSRVEPWGVVLQEAAAAGLPLIASEACGAAVHLLTEGHNGYTFQTGNAAHLTRCLHRVAGLDEAQWSAMSRASFELSRQYTPDHWADKLMGNLARM